MKQKNEIDCEYCDAFDHDYGQCTIPSPDLIFACPKNNNERGEK